MSTIVLEYIPPTTTTPLYANTWKPPIDELKTRLAAVSALKKLIDGNISEPQEYPVLYLNNVNIVSVPEEQTMSKEHWRITCHFELLDQKNEESITSHDEFRDLFGKLVDAVFNPDNRLATKADKVTVSSLDTLIGIGPAGTWLFSGDFNVTIEVQG